MSEFVEFLHEVFEEFGSISMRRMFGGHGVFHDGLMIGLVADDTLYLKSDKDTVDRFNAHKLAQFKYQKGDKLVRMSFYQAPEECLEDSTAMKTWADLAYEAAVRSKR